MRRSLPALLLGLILAYAPVAHAQGEWEQARPVRIILPFPPGGRPT